MFFCFFTIRAACAARSVKKQTNHVKIDNVLQMVKVPQNSVRDALQHKNIKDPEIAQEARADPKQ